MNMMRLMVAALVLACLGGFVWWSNKQEAAKAEAPDPKAPPKVLKIIEADITTLAIEHRGEPATVLNKDDAGKWSITAPQALAADQAAASGLVASAATLDSDHVVDENATNLASYGLDPPAISLKLTTKDGTTHLRIGDDTPDRAGSYVAVDGDKRLFTIASSTKTTFDKRAKDLREKHLLVFNPDKLSRVELNVAGKAPLEFGRGGNSQWQILKPRPLRADGFQVEDLIRKLKDSEMDVNTDEKQAASGYASGRPVAIARITGAEGVFTLEVRQNANDYFARSSAVPGTYKVPADLGMGLNKSLEDFQNKKVFDFGFDDLTRVEYTSKGDTRIIEKSGESWTSAGKTMDSISVQNFIDKLRDMSGESVTAGSFGAAEISLTVISKGGERTEKVQIAPQGTKFAARRENEPSLYPLDASIITGLREAIAGVREPPPPAKEDKAKK